jgi:GT2 family glycosyltransferase
MLNPDTRPQPESLILLIDLLNSNKKIAAVGSQLQDFDGTRQISAFNYPSICGEFLSSSRLGVIAKFIPSAVVACE